MRIPSPIYLEAKRLYTSSTAVNGYSAIPTRVAPFYRPTLSRLSLWPKRPTCYLKLPGVQLCLPAIPLYPQAWLPLNTMGSEEWKL